MPTDSILDRIAAATRRDLAARQAAAPLDELRARIATLPAPRPFGRAVSPRLEGPARLVAEVKRASPSKGLLAERFDPAAQARAYERGGAAAISVLTEPHFFQGSLDHLRAVREVVGVPVLRKDFILDPYQVYEAREVGADALLLICALLDDATLAELLALTRSLGMEALVEVHDAAEVRRALAVGATVIGVNSRDLRTFEINPDVVRDLRPLVPNEVTFVAESGISSATDMARVRAFGGDAILVGEALMRAADPVAKARELAHAPGGATVDLFTPGGRPFVKLCGLTKPEQVELAIDLNASAFGLVFAPSHRHVTLAQADALAETVLHSDGSIRAIGVFVNEEPCVIEQIAATLALDAVQLSGDETPELCAEVAALAHCHVIKAVRLRTEADLDRLDAYAMAGATLLLDTPAPAGVYGGTGQTADWALAREAARRWPIILSGGLTPENVATAIAAVRPAGVDVSSGIETNHVKDPDKMRAFVQAVRAAANQEIEAIQ
ncbi:MAG TPA: indole-3-glycerol phosphate synthase TrpC [Ktedonobacterales bacterium]